LSLRMICWKVSIARGHRWQAQDFTRFREVQKRWQRRTPSVREAG